MKDLLLFLLRFALDERTVGEAFLFLCSFLYTILQLTREASAV